MKHITYIALLLCINNTSIYGSNSDNEYSLLLQTPSTRLSEERRSQLVYELANREGCIAPCCKSSSTKINELFYPEGPWYNPDAGNCAKRYCFTLMQNDCTCSTFKRSWIGTTTASAFASGLLPILALPVFMCKHVDPSQTVIGPNLFAGSIVSGVACAFLSFFSCLLCQCTECDACLLDYLSNQDTWQTRASETPTALQMKEEPRDIFGDDTE